MQVVIKNVSVETGGKAPRFWHKAIVEYTYNGEARKQNVMSFSSPDVFKKVQEMVGQSVNVELAKDDKGYTQWKSITVADAGGASSTLSGGQPTAAPQRAQGNWETREERAARQIYIVKQSSLSTAVAALTIGAKTPPKADEIIALAQEFTDWVFDASTEPDSAPSTLGDIPF